jgi:hypothetical protein
VVATGAQRRQRAIQRRMAQHTVQSFAYRGKNPS